MASLGTQIVPDQYLATAIDELKVFIAKVESVQVPTSLPPEVYQYVMGTLGEVRNRSMQLLSEVDPELQQEIVTMPNGYVQDEFSR